MGFKFRKISLSNNRLWFTSLVVIVGRLFRHPYFFLIVFLNPKKAAFTPASMGSENLEIKILDATKLICFDKSLETFVYGHLIAGS